MKPGRNGLNKKLSLPELRKNARIALRIEYELTLNNQQYTGDTGDISLGGASLISSTPPLNTNQALETGQISLTLGQKNLSMECIVVYVGNSNIPGFSKTGITFKNMNEDDRNKLLRFMVQHL